jgi:hypothetical protein
MKLTPSMYDSESSSSYSDDSGYEEEFRPITPALNQSSPSFVMASEVDWTRHFLEIMEKIESNRADFVDYNKLSNLANNFLEVAKSYGKIIISEEALPPEKKTIKPTNIGGIAGGQKFRVQNIIFKVSGYKGVTNNCVVCVGLAELLWGMFCIWEL